jgi:hypothetical protein
MADANTGTSGLIRVTASIVDQSAEGLWWDIAWSFQLIERVSAGSTFTNIPKDWNVSIEGVGVVASGTYTFDWRPAGLQSQTIASATTRVTAPPSGSGAGLGDVTGYIAASGTSGAGGPTSVTQSVTPPTLTVVPGTPSAVTATRVSDTEITVAWSQSSASNGAPTANTIQRRVNGGDWVDAVTIAPTTSASVSAAADQKLEYRVKGSNAAGDSAWSAASTAIYTTPDAPTAVSASKDSALDITVAWTPNVAFVEHEHVVEHGVDVAGTITWDGSPLAVVTAGTSTYPDEDPDPADVHVYRVFARNTDTGALESAKVLSNTVQLLAAPNAPTLANLPNFAAKTLALVVGWTHNPVDTTGQTAYELEYSTNGGSSYTSTGKVTSTTPSYTVAADTYAANVALTVRVRTWGEATTGGSDGTGASPWSTTDTVTFKTRPVATISSPADLSTYTLADLTLALGFSQAESATFVSATIVLSEGATELESRLSTTLAGTLMDTQVEDASTYTLSVTVLDSNGLTSVAVESTFDVAYTKPVAATFTPTYDEESGTVELAVTIPAAGVGEAEAVAVTISRVISGGRETLRANYPVTPGSITFIDTTPVTFGSNQYRVRTISEDGATTDTVSTLAVTDRQWAYLSTGDAFDTIVRFSRRLTLDSSVGRQSTEVETSGRELPIGLFGENVSMVARGVATVLDDEVATLVADGGSSIGEIEQFLRVAKRVCYRDPTGRRIFGRVLGSFSNRDGATADFVFTVSENS